jgi:glutathione S-transferase
MPYEYVIHGAPFSLFTRKLEAALQFYELPFRLETAGIGGDGAAAKRADTHQIPVLQTPENWMIADTTPILDLLDARVPARRLFPSGPLGVLVHILEEVLDEWVARVMVHFRWHYAENTRHIVGQFLGREVSLAEAAEFPLAKWGPRACRATGTELEFHQQAAEEEYFALLAALETQLGETVFALGDRPTAVDTILLGGLRAHTNADPLPDLSAYPRCTAWCEGTADLWKGDGQLAPFPQSTPFAAHVLTLARDEYVPFLLGNAKALETSQKAFSVETHGQTASYLARPYPEKSREMLKDRIRNQLDASEREQVEGWLENKGLSAAFLP